MPNFIISEIFPILTESLPTLNGYQLVSESGEAWKIGGKLAYRLTKSLGGHWNWADSRIISDMAVPKSDIDEVVKEAWSAQPDVYQHLERVDAVPTWKPSAYAQATFVAYGYARDHSHNIRKILAENRADLGAGYIERIYDIRPWVVNSKPSLSISVHSRLVHKQDVSEYASNLRSPEELVELWAADKNTTFKGQITAFVGPLKEHRDRLVRLSQNEDTIETLRNSPDDTPVLRVGREQFDYVATSLRLIMTMENMHLFGIDRKKAQRNLRIAPEARHKMNSKIAALLRLEHLIGFEYQSKDNPELFLTSDDVDVDPRIRLGDGTIVEHDNRMYSNVKRHGLYQVSPDFRNGVSVRMGVVKSGISRNLQNFYDTLKKEVSDFGLSLNLVAIEEAMDQTRFELEKSIDRLDDRNVDFVLGIFGEGPAYYSFKNLTVGRGLPSQVVQERTLENEFAVPNIVLGILGKTGNIPYVLATPLPYADILVGIDIARERKKRLPGSINIAAIARIYFSNGQFIRYVIHDEPIEGETIPRRVLQSMFPASEFSGKRVVVHRDGSFRGQEKDSLYQWAKEIGATIHLVEVIKSGAPRLYGAGSVGHPPSGIGLPIKGSAFRLGQQEAILVSTLPPFKNATPQPLRIKSDRSISIEKAVNSVLSLTYLHYGSVRPPRLPVTVHFSDKIAGLALQGVKPRNLEGNRPFWL